MERSIDLHHNCGAISPKGRWSVCACAAGAAIVHPLRIVKLLSLPSFHKDRCAASNATETVPLASAAAVSTTWLPHAY